jgi:hypothetical protein
MSFRAKRSNLAPKNAPNGIGNSLSSTPLRAIGAAGLAASLFFGLLHGAEARPARCYTSDEGVYDCDFAAGPQGGFTISASGKPTVILNIDAPGTAFGFARLGGRNVPLPGRYRRSAADPACWKNDATGARVCAWGRH